MGYTCLPLLVLHTLYILLRTFWGRRKDTTISTNSLAGPQVTSLLLHQELTSVPFLQTCLLQIMELRRLQSEMVYSATAMVEQNLQLLIIHWNLPSEMF